MDLQKSLQKTTGTALRKQSMKRISNGMSLQKIGTSQKPNPDSGKTFVKRKSVRVRNTSQQRRVIKIGLIQRLGRKLRAKKILNLTLCTTKMVSLMKPKLWKIIYG